MNAEKLAKLQSQVRIGGKGTARRKKKVVHRTATTDDKKLQTALKKMGGSAIPGIEEVNMFKDDGTVLHFNNPKVQAALSANTFSVTGQAENKKIKDMLPSILNQLRPENIDWESLSQMLQQQNLAGGLPGATETKKEGEDDDDDIPELVENFEEAAKK